MTKVKLEKIVIKTCEKLPLGSTFFGKDGQCFRPNHYCVYCQKENDIQYNCNKYLFTKYYKINPYEG